MNDEYGKVLFEESEVERDVSRIAPSIKEAFAAQGGPSEDVLATIHREAVSAAARNSRGWMFRVVRSAVKIAAVFVLLLAGIMFYQHSQNPAPAKHMVSLHQKTAVAKNAAAAANVSDAELLLDIQGMDDESFLTGEEEALWL